MQPRTGLTGAAALAAALASALAASLAKRFCSLQDNQQHHHNRRRLQALIEIWHNVTADAKDKYGMWLERCIAGCV